MSDKRHLPREQLYDWTSAYKKFEYIEEENEVKPRDSKIESSTCDRKDRGRCCAHDHSSERKIMEMSEDEKISVGNECRLKGNDYFHEGQFARAANQYQQALSFRFYVFPTSTAQKEEMESIVQKCLLNSVSCLVKLGNVSEALKNCEQALEKEPWNVKAIFKLGQILRLKDSYDAAISKLSSALKISPNDEAIINEMVLVKEKKSSYLKHSLIHGQKMFKRDQSEGSKIISQVNSTSCNSSSRNVYFNHRQSRVSADSITLLDASLNVVAYRKYKLD